MKNREAEIHVTDECSHDCVFCSVKKHSGSPLILEEIKNNIKLSIPFKKLIISGGEPLIRKDISKIIQFANTNKNYIIMETNLILLNEKLLKEIIKAGLNELKISFHSYNKKFYEKITKSKNFEKLLTNMALLKKYKNKIKISTNTVITKYNYKDLDKIVNFFEEKYSFIKEIRISYPRFYPIKGCKDYSKQYLVSLKKIKNPLRKINNKENIILENIPLCIMNNKRAEKINWNIWLIKRGKILKGLEGRYFPKKCLGCKKKKRCQGIHKYYSLYFNENFVKPFK